MTVPFLDLRLQYQRIKAEIDAAVADVFETQRFLGGPNVERLEDELAGWVGAEHAIGVASGTDALILSLKALGVGPGDEVIVPAFTFFATAGAVVNAGAEPVFIDIEPDTFNLDAGQLADRITPRTKAVIPVHLFGQCADMDSVLALAEDRGLHVIEDGAQALGAKYHGRPACTMGKAGALSFYPTKNLGGAGDGGMVVTSDPWVRDRIRMLRDHGASRAMYHHEVVGTNSRLGAIQGAVLRVKLPHLAKWAEERRSNAAYYDERLAPLDRITRPAVHDGCEHVFNQYVIRVPRRDAARDHLTAHGVGCSVFYPVPLHLQHCFLDLGHKQGDFPVAEQACREVLALPIFPELARAQQDEVVDALARFTETLD